MAIEQSTPECSVEIKKIMDEVMDSQIRGWSGQMFYSVVPHSEGMEASAGFEDNGYWESWNGYSVGNPIKFTEAHSNKNLAEIVCSNSFKSNLHTNACGVLKEELRYSKIF